ncbi:MAG: hypothetical protein K9J27_01995 [Bacteroidales bacterium]|nr:hypothetical protein [Bacteroidales bacterium]MCF8332740.1 hypothetical protein [Bacteroidales bacterium]
MYKRKITLFVLVLAVLSFIPYSSSAREWVKDTTNNKRTKTIKSTAAGCLPAMSYQYLDVNNVRARINTGGDMWWDFENGKYEIPKGTGQTSMFSAALWLGGVDVNDQLKLAAQMYRYGPDQQGSNTVDYWTGPLSVDGAASVSQQTCKEYDRMFPITRQQVNEFVAKWDKPEQYPDYSIPRSIREWPAHGDITKGQSFYLAPFYDNNGDGEYNPSQGDYPYYDLSGDLCGTQTPTKDEEAGDVIPNSSVLADQVIKGDETLWWVFNDKGNTHTETEGTPIGVEIRAQAFGFSTNDEVDNMSFYSYEIINRSTFTLQDTYFSQWVDTDLGDHKDDYVGCDVERGLGYCYNGRNVDGQGQPWTYGENPPAIGVDFFQGPYIDDDGQDNAAFTGDCSIFDYNAPAGSANDGSAINGVNFGDSIVDNERFGMRRFVYHNNPSWGAAGPYMHDPEYAIDYYNYLRGIWKDGTKMLYGGNAHESSGAYGPECDFMFPGNTDPCNWGTNGQAPSGPKQWTEETAGNEEGDRRFMQSAGPFTLKPGGVNYITVGIPWARADRGGPFASVEKLRVADDKAQALFENCFQVVNGPNAPDLTIKEEDNELTVFLTNRDINNTGNNYREQYEEIDPTISSPDSLSSDERWDSTYNFEGYKVYQIASPDVSPDEFDNPDKAQLVMQCDVKNGVDRLINYEYNENLDAAVPVLKVDGADEGITHSFTLKEDYLAGEPLVNHKQYYFKAVAYAYNNYRDYDPEVQPEGQKLPYLEGRKNIQTYTGIPHKNVRDLKAQADYGDGIPVTRVQGQGNSGNYLELQESVYQQILSMEPYDTTMSVEDDNYPLIRNLSYKGGSGPVSVKVIDPHNVKAGQFALIFDSLRRHNLTNITGEPNAHEGGDTASYFVTTWYLKDLNTGDVHRADTTLVKNNEQLFLDLGISVEMKQVFRPGARQVGKVAVGEDAQTGDTVFEPLPGYLAQNNGLIGASMKFGDSTNRWLSGVPDNDNSVLGYTDWIKAGTAPTPEAGEVYNPVDAGLRGNEPGYAYDPTSVFESILNGTWAPYKMTATFREQDAGPVYHKANVASGFSRNLAKWDKISSVDVIITSDSTKWTRCPVVETNPNEELAEGGASQLSSRRAPSVNIHGEAGVESDDPLLNSSYVDSTGMGWFPGYAVNVETGERLNMAFGEDSWLVQENGRDMIWNPTSKIFNKTGDVVLGGKHTVYVFAQDTVAPDAFAYEDTPTIDAFEFVQPVYDAGKSMKKMLDSAQFSPFIGESVTSPREFVYSTAIWVNMPLAADTSEWLANDVKIELRVNKPFGKFNTAIADLGEYEIPQVDVNAGYPVYKFATDGVAPVEKDEEDVQKDLDLISVVPNPYYGYSKYEQNQLDNRVKFTNLPERCTITIYNVSGTMIRQYKKDNPSTQLDWDLNNFAGIPVAGGVYYIHVDAPGKGERVVKWFGAMRPTDLNAF